MSARITALDEEALSHTGCIRMRATTRLHAALKNLGAAMREVDAALDEMRAEHDPLAVHIFVSPRQYRNVSDTKSGKRAALAAAAQLAGSM